MSFERKEDLDVELDHVVPCDCGESSNGHKDSSIHCDRRRGRAIISPHDCGYVPRDKVFQTLSTVLISRVDGVHWLLLTLRMEIAESQYRGLLFERI